MAQYTTYAEFKKIYQAAPYSQMFSTSGALADAWRHYQLTGELPVLAGAEPTTPTAELTEVAPAPTAVAPAPIEPLAPAPMAPVAPVAMPTFGTAAIPPPVVTPAPPYEVSPELQEAMDLYGAKLTDWVESGGYGLSPEIQAQMIQQQTDTLKAREEENIRVMRNNMERRGITNSGFLISAENNIHANTSVAIAGAIADVQIKSALMKMASFEKAMGAMAQFLGFLSEQSQLAYQPEFATWQAQQLATMQHWQGQMDIYKMELNQAYQTQNLLLQGQIQSDLAEQQHGYNIELTEMEIEMNQNIAMAQGVGGIFGTILGFIFGK